MDKFETAIYYYLIVFFIIANLCFWGLLLRVFIESFYSKDKY
jgi:hypothetical protein